MFSQKIILIVSHIDEIFSFFVQIFGNRQYTVMYAYFRKTFSEHFPNFLLYSYILHVIFVKSENENFLRNPRINPDL
jgi:hypothetical protein